MADLPGAAGALRKFVGLGLKISHVHRTPFEHGASANRSPDDRDDEAGGLRDRTVVRVRPQILAVEAEDGRVRGCAEAGRALDDRLQDRLEVRGRRADDPQDLGGGRLLFERLGEVGVLGLKIVDQPGVLDRNHGLVGEGGHEVDLLVAEGADLGPVHEEHADQIVLFQHRDARRGSLAAHPLGHLGFVLGVGEDVDDVDDPALERGPSDRRAASGADDVLSPVLAELGTGPIVRKKPEHLAVETRQQTALGPGQPGRVLDEGLEHGLEIERGAADHLEDFAGGRLLLQRDP